MGGRRGSKMHLRDTKEAIDSAVKSVNKVLSSNAAYSHSKPNGKESAIDESLDSLDFFKVTNLGRMQN